MSAHNSDGNLCLHVCRDIACQCLSCRHRVCALYAYISSHLTVIEKLVCRLTAPIRTAVHWYSPVCRVWFARSKDSSLESLVSSEMLKLGSPSTIACPFFLHTMKNAPGKLQTTLRLAFSRMIWSSGATVKLASCNCATAGERVYIAC